MNCAPQLHTQQRSSYGTTDSGRLSGERQMGCYDFIFVFFYSLPSPEWLEMFEILSQLYRESYLSYIVTLLWKLLNLLCAVHYFLSGFLHILIGDWFEGNSY